MFALLPGLKQHTTTSDGQRIPHSAFALEVRSFCKPCECMDLLQACDEMKAFIKTAQRLIEAWEKDPDNYSKLEDGLNAMKAELEKFKD